MILQGVQGAIAASRTSRDQHVLANNCNLPVNIANLTTPVLNCWSSHKAVQFEGEVPQVTFVNGGLTTNGELNGKFDYTQRCGVYIPALKQFHRGYNKDNGTSIDKVLRKEWGIGTWVYPDWEPLPGQEFIITNRRVATDIGQYPPVAITSIVAGSQPLVTAPGHNFINGLQIAVSGVTGTPSGSINATFLVTNCNIGAGTFQLQTTSGGNISTGNTWVYTSGGTATRSYAVFISTGGRTARADGIMGSHDPDVDYTLGVGVAHGRQALPIDPSKCVAGKLLSGTGTILYDPDNLGFNYTSNAQSIEMWHGPAGPGAPGAERPGLGVSASGVTVSGNPRVNIANSAAGGSGLDPQNLPLPKVGGSGTPDTGFGTNAAIYGPALITARPKLGYSAQRSLKFLVNSLQSYGSADATGTLNASFGCLEQICEGRIATSKTGISGNSASGVAQTIDKQIQFILHQISMGMVPQGLFIDLATNDFLTNTASTVITGVFNNYDLLGNIFRDIGFEDIYFATIPPCTITAQTTPALKFTTLEEQTPYLVSGSDANWKKGGRVEEFNARLLANEIPNSGILKIGDMCRGTGDYSACWRTDAFGGNTAFCNDDSIGSIVQQVGIHISQEVGIAYIKQNCEEILETLGYPVEQTLQFDQLYRTFDRDDVTFDMDN